MTSGATGEPKMGLVTHHALVSNIDMAPAVLPLTPDDVTIAFLPSAHIAQRVVVQLVPLRQGSEVWFSEGLSKLPHEIRTIRPTFFLAPPRVWERVYSTISTEIRKRPAAVRKLFYMGLGAGVEGQPRYGTQGKPVPALVARIVAILRPRRIPENSASVWEAAFGSPRQAPLPWRRISPNSTPPSACR